jgi:hypothetical protein
MIQTAPVAPPLEQKAQDGDVRVRRDARGGGVRPVPGVARAGSSRKLVLLGTFPLKHDVPPRKSNGELFPTAPFRAGYGCFSTNNASDAV